MSELTRAVEALLFISTEPLSVRELAELTESPPERVERALDALLDRYCEERSGVILERAAGGYGFRASAATADVCARLVERPPARGLPRPRSRRSRWSPTWRRSAGPRSPASAASPPTRPSRA